MKPKGALSPVALLQDQIATDNWPIRRRWMFLILLWTAANAEYIIIWGDDTALHQNAFLALLALIGAILGSYVFGAIWDDKSKRQTMTEVVALDPVIAPEAAVSE